MEINISNFVLFENPNEYSNSIANMGKDAGKITWNNALNCDFSFVNRLK